MFKTFYELFSWYEYLVRVDWTPDGQSYFFFCCNFLIYFIYLSINKCVRLCVQILDRSQYHSATILIPLDFFVPSKDLIDEMQISSYDTPNVYCIIERTSDLWINVKKRGYFIHLILKKIISNLK